jgi:ATP-binding cassette subfamily B protein
MQKDKTTAFTIERGLGLVRAVRLVCRSAPGWTILNAALQTVQGTLPLLSLYLMKLIVDAVASALASPSPGVVFGRVALFISLAGAVALIGEHVGP